MITEQVCISFLLHRGMVVIPKSVNPKRIAENIKATQIQLDAEDVEKIEAIDRGTRMFRVCSVRVCVIDSSPYTVIIMQMEFFLKEGVTWQEAWDEEADAKFELK